MAKSPAFNFYSSDFLTGTIFMEDHEVGKYAKLMCIQHQKGHMSLEQMEVVCKGSVPKNVMANYTQDDAGLYYNKRLEKVIAEKQEYCEKQASNLGEYRGLTRAQIAELKVKKAKEVGEPPIIESSTPGEEEIHKEKARRPVVFKPSALEEVEKYFKEHGYGPELAKRAWEGYEVNNWIDTKGNQIRNWKQKMIQVWFTEEHKTKMDRGQRPGQIIVDGSVKAKFNTD